MLTITGYITFSQEKANSSSVLDIIRLNIVSDYRCNGKHFVEQGNKYFSLTVIKVGTVFQLNTDVNEVDNYT